MSLSERARGPLFKNSKAARYYLSSSSSAMILCPSHEWSSCFPGLWSRRYKQSFIPPPPAPCFHPHDFNKWVDCPITQTSNCYLHYPWFPKAYPHTLLLPTLTSWHITDVLFFLRDRGGQFSAPGLVESSTRIQLYDPSCLCCHQSGRFPISLQCIARAWEFRGEISQKQQEQLLFLTFSVIKCRCQILDKQMSSLDQEKWRATRAGWITDAVNGASKKFIWGYIQEVFGLCSHWMSSGIPIEVKMRATNKCHSSKWAYLFFPQCGLGFF